MINNIKNIIETIFSNPDIVIEGTGPKTWNLEGISISLKKDPLKYFVLLTSNKHDIDWIIHFENDSTKPFTDEEKFILFDAVSEIIAPDDILTSEGGITPGGISGINRLTFHGFKIIGKNSGQHVYWASDKILDREKFDNWIKDANPEDYKIKNKSEGLTVENTRPVVKILQRI